jgi:hypothetical protein
VHLQGEQGSPAFERESRHCQFRVLERADTTDPVFERADTISSGFEREPTTGLKHMPAEAALVHRTC